MQVKLAVRANFILLFSNFWLFYFTIQMIVLIGSKGVDQVIFQGPFQHKPFHDISACFVGTYNIYMVYLKKK